MVGSPELTALFMTRSSARPRLLFAVRGDGDEWLFYSAPQPENPYEKSSLVLAADFHTKFGGGGSMCRYVSGLIYDFRQGMIYNPITGQYVTLPKINDYKQWTSCLGFDPIDKQFKVLACSYDGQRAHHKILTLGTGKLRWRKISFDCPGYDLYLSDGICIDGVLYYLAADKGAGKRMICFDVRSEKFKFIDGDCFGLFQRLINYKGKLGGIRLESAGINNTPELCMWVLEKHEWFKYVYTLPENEQVVVDYCNLYVDGVTSTGEIVFSSASTPHKLFCLYYFNPERNTFQRIEIQGLGAQLKHPSVVWTFVDHVEDLRLIDAKHLCSIRL